MDGGGAARWAEPSEAGTALPLGSAAKASPEHSGEVYKAAVEAV